MLDSCASECPVFLIAAQMVAFVGAYAPASKLQEPSVRRFLRTSGWLVVVGPWESSVTMFLSDLGFKCALAAEAFDCRRLFVWIAIWKGPSNGAIGRWFHFLTLVASLMHIISVHFPSVCHLADAMHSLQVP